MPVWGSLKSLKRNHTSSNIPCPNWLAGWLAGRNSYSKTTTTTTTTSSSSPTHYAMLLLEFSLRSFLSLFFPPFHILSARWRGVSRWSIRPSVRASVARSHSPLLLLRSILPIALLVADLRMRVCACASVARSSPSIRPSAFDDQWTASNHSLLSQWGPVVEKKRDREREVAQVVVDPSRRSRRW